MNIIKYEKNLVLVWQKRQNYIGYALAQMNGVIETVKEK